MTTLQQDLVRLDDIRDAAARVSGLVVRTPLLPCPWADDLWLKPESLQPIGAFKLRGATNALHRLDLERRSIGVVTHSSGNHGQALAYAGRALGIPVTVVMPDVSTPLKIEATRGYGAEVLLVPQSQREIVARQLVAERGLTLIPPYDHPDIIAGQGTVGLEIFEDLSSVDVVLVPVGGGGLSSGVATAVKSLAPRVAVIGVEPAVAADAAESLAAGVVRTLPEARMLSTVADGLRTPLSELTLAHLSTYLDAIITVSEDEILDTVKVLARKGRLIAEPSGAVATAAVLHHRDALPAGRTVAVVSGGNLDPKLAATLFA
ncbi:threonine/serine dehydratase [Dactylosporangium sp. AC04546]|uniref:threonine ammonia-lyase n=1 Tax=Dactylosporangium sp. AC04546 TaxID=2862460 RepID=UPI001EDCA764|nr:threonine/serine dehydratase [Dactylosporangium sp. AC04546]WVK83604.1 threonine/serine dehydratase [Dactylosporangium sp. AC04546]